MTILNKEILICKTTMINSIENIMNQVMERYFEDEVLCKTIEQKQKMMKSLIKEKKNETKTNYFWYLNSSGSVCTFIHKRGKNEGHMCHRKIKTNLNGEKPDYLCSIHSKKHIAKKREKINKNIIKIAEKKRKDTKKIKKRKIKKIYICNGGLLNFSDIINKIM